MRIRTDHYDVAVVGTVITVTERRRGVSRSLELPDGEALAALSLLLSNAQGNEEPKSAPQSSQAPEQEPEKKKTTTKKRTKKEE